MFLIVLPIALTALAVGMLVLRNVGEVRRSSLDILSVVLAAIGFGGFVYGVSLAGEAPGAWSQPQVLLPVSVGGVSLLVVVLRTFSLQKTDNPLLDLHVFRYTMLATRLAMLMICIMVRSC